MDSFVRRHAGFLALLALVAPLLAAFSWHHGLGTVGDDSVSYLNIARYFRHPSDPLVAEWVGYQTHFPPLFPGLLAATGGSDDFLVANLLVAGFAILALCAVYAYSALCLQNRRGALAIAAVFMVLPTAWISIRGILTEPQFLAITFAFLLLHEARLAHGGRRAAEWALLGALLGCAWLTRSAGTALVAAYAVHAAIGLVRDRGREAGRRLLPLAVFAAMAAAWLVLRPAPQGELYANVLRTVSAWISRDPAGYAATSVGHLAGGWVASFMAEPVAGALPRAVLLAVGLAGVAGAIRRAWANHVDGWYVLATLAMLFLWTFPDDAMRRLLYPVAPLLLLHAVMLARPAVAALPRAFAARWAWPTIAALPLLFTLPATQMVAQRALDRAPVLDGAPYSLAQIADYYTVIPEREARSRAARMAGVLAGFDAIRAATPSDARILWMRPDYVAVLARRRGVAWYYRGGLDGLLRDALESRADYLVAGSTYKADMVGEQDERFENAQVLSAIASPVIVVKNAVLGEDDFVLMKIDREALAAAVRSRGPTR